MSNQFIVRDVERDTERPVESRSEAEEVASDLRGIVKQSGGNPESIEIVPPKGTDGGTTVVEDSRDESPTGNNEQPETPATDEYELPDRGPSVDEDPLVWMPDEFTDTIDGTVAINRKGFEVLAHHYDIQCETELVEPLTESDKVTFKATAIDSDGDRYSAFGSASKERGDDVGLLVEMADTRAYKRAISRSTGVGMVAVSELQNTLDEP